MTESEGGGGEAKAESVSQVLTIPIPDHQAIELRCEPGAVFFIIGPNGSGKSALIGSLAAQIDGRIFRRITAHRQNWTSGDGPNFASGERAQREEVVASYSVRADRRYLDHDAALYANLALARLIAGENSYHRSYRESLIASKKEVAEYERERKESPLEVVNGLLLRGGLMIRLRLKSDDTLEAVASNGVAIGVSRLSDGERNAIFLCAEMLDAPPGAIILVDEPERHLHQAIMVPFLHALVRKRNDCTVIIATHELDLPEGLGDACVVLLQAVRWNGDSATVFEADLVPGANAVSEDVRRSILGARRTVLFIEGTDSSLDLSLYSLLLPNVTARPVGGCRNVIASVDRFRAGASMHWVSAYGLIDRDGRSSSDIHQLESRGIYALEVATIEGLYYSAEAVDAVAVAESKGEFKKSGSEVLSEALECLVEPETVHKICWRRVIDDVRGEVQAKLPTAKSFGTYSLEVDLDERMSNELQRFLSLVRDKDVAGLLRRYSLKGSGFYDGVSRTLGHSKKSYEARVLDLVQKRNGLRETLRLKLNRVASKLEE